MVTEAKFTNCVEDEMNEILSLEDSILVVFDFKCWCYDEAPRPAEHLVVKRKNATGITVGEVVQAMVDVGFDPVCNHHFLEGFVHLRNNIFQAAFGS